GIYIDATNNTRALMQAVLDSKNYDAADLYYETRLPATADGYSNQSFPTTNTTINGTNYYDDYDFDNNGSPDYTYANQSLGAEEPVPTTQTRGALTGTRKRILGTNTWLIEVVYYDRYGRVVQKRNNNQLNTTVEDVTTIVLDFEGKVLKKKTFQKTSPTQSITLVDLYDYDAAGRVLLVKQNINPAQGGTATNKVIAQYKYNELGQLVEKNLSGMGATGTEGFLQSVDLKYNIRGWLTHINNSELKYDKVANDDNDDVFGMELLYEKTDAPLANAAKFNGNISSVKWQHNDALTSSQPKRQRAYAFDYYNNDQLKHANYKAWSGTGWTAEVGGFDMKNLSYDHNGNMLGYERYSKATDAAANTKIDQLTYTYTGNLLTKVEDVASTAGFANGSNLASEYTYDASGNLTADQNKGITLTYNELNKTVSVAKAGQGSLTYEYDANGTRLSTTTVQGATSSKQCFIDGFVYQDGTLLYYGMAEGKVNRKSDGTFEYEYMVTDHQGNVRVTFKELVQTTTYTATLEDNGTATPTNPRVIEMQNYESLFDVEQPQVGPWLNKTAATTAVPSPNRAAYLTGLANRKIGPGISLKVKPGDALHMEAFGKFLKPSANASFGNTIVTGLAAAFGGSFAGVNGLEGSSPVSAIYNSASAIIGTNYGGSQTDRPRAYINYLLFDSDFNFVDAGWDRIDAASGYLVNQENTVAWDKVQLDITVAKAGYVYIYLSNESEGTSVYFDDMSVTHIARIPQVTTANDYYPFGMRMEGVVNNTAISNATGQYTYNGGSAWQNGAGNFANFLSTPLREYDPVLGRFNGIDVMATKYAGLSPYVYALNNPVYWSDPSGADVTWDDIFRAVRTLLASEYGGTWKNTELADGGGGGGGGELTLFTSAPVVVNNGAGSYTVYTTMGQAYYSNKGNYSGGIETVIFEFNKMSVDVTSLNASGTLDLNKFVEESRDPRLAAAIGTTGFFLNALQTATDLSLSGAKPLYTGPQAWANLKATGRTVTRYLGIVGLVVTIYDVKTAPKVSSAHILDGAFGVIGFIPGAGSIIAAGYFISNTITIMTTGKSIGQHLDDFIEAKARENAGLN
ncbi:MAG: hypothetical protein HOP30_09080, partial [Cyclobacteriaceae bacterium]|nr:hypothetical protein [Cyclobacteriaceae bacterium]